MKLKTTVKAVQEPHCSLRWRRDRRRGVALITALILLSVAMLLGITVVMTTSSDVFISGSMRNSKTSFYAADGGVTILRNALITALQNRTPGNLVGDASTILPSDIASLVQGDALGIVGNGSNQAFSLDSSYGDLASTFNIDTGQTTLTLASAPQISVNNGIRSENYRFAYQIVSNGASRGQAVSTVIETGTIYYNLEVLPSSKSTYAFSFAGYGLFVDQYTGYPPLLKGWITGRAHTNGEWGFASGSPGYGFTDRITSVNSNAKFVFGSSIYESNSDSMSKNGTTIAPQFLSGFTRSAQSVPLPQNSNNQARAVLDGIGYDPNNPLALQPSPTSAELTAKLVGVFGNTYAGGNGVYIPVANGAISGGGVYVQGDADEVTLDATQPMQQIYTVRQGSSTTQVIINMDPKNLSTTITDPTVTTFDPSRTHRYLGVPTAVYPVNPNRDPSIQPLTSVSFFFNGAISSLHGPGAGQPAVQDRAGMTITSTGNITVTGDVLYKTEPITRVANEVWRDANGNNLIPPNSPAGTLIPGNDNGQALGIFTATGNVMLDVSGISSRNIEIDASMATLSNGGTGGITVASGSPYANNILIVGGRIQNQLKVLGDSNTVRNVMFDRRYANSAYAPPFFPATSAQFALTTIWDRVNGSRPVAVPTSYVVPSRLVAAANAGH